MVNKFSFLLVYRRDNIFLFRCNFSQNLALQRFNVTTICAIFCMGITTSLSDSIFGWVRAFGSTTKYWQWDSRNENDITWCCTEGISNIQNARSESNWFDSDAWIRLAAWQRSKFDFVAHILISSYFVDFLIFHII